MKPSRAVVVGVAALAVLVAVVLAVWLGGGSDAPEPRPVKEIAASPRPVATELLENERHFTYLDTEYGRCLHQNGVTDFPPLSKPLELDTADPVVAKALTACEKTRPTNLPTGS